MAHEYPAALQAMIDADRQPEPTRGQRDRQGGPRGGKRSEKCEHVNCPPTPGSYDPVVRTILSQYVAAVNPISTRTYCSFPRPSTFQTSSTRSPRTPYTCSWRFTATQM